MCNQLLFVMSLRAAVNVFRLKSKTDMMRHRFRYKFLILTILTVLIIALPVQAAERIYLNYSLFGFSVTVDQLETFAETGELEGALAYYLKRFSPERRSQIQEVLQARYPVNPVMVDRFAYTSSGERLFREIGEIIQTETRQNGAKAIRSAAILSATDPDGISIVSFLKQFPTDIRIDIRRVLRMVQRFSNVLQETEQTVNALNQQTQQIAATEPKVNYSQLPDLRQPGNFSYQKQTLNLYDAERDRKFSADLYLPDVDLSTPEAATPVIVMSNGLGAGRDRFDEIAPHLASYGFAIAIPDHPGSDRQRLREFYAGLHQENFDATEYLDRPKDITFLLNELEQLNYTTLNNRLNLQQVGIFGYSFGGNTALALAGAEIDLDYLKTECETQSGVVNISLIYQCRALELAQPPASLRDERIKAAFLFVPFGKSLFGQGIAKTETPVFWQVTDLDVLTPFAVEQTPAFAALTIPDKYFAVTQGLPHARVTYDAISRLTNNSTPWETLKAIAHNYQNALSLAFFKVYVAEAAEYRPYLQSSYVLFLSTEPYMLSLVQSLPAKP